MAIITIARQMGSLGSETAAQVAQRLDYTLVDQAKLQQAAENYGMLKSELEEVRELDEDLAGVVVHPVGADDPPPKSRGLESDVLHIPV